MNYSGVVSKITDFDFNGTKLWSFQLQNVRSYFRYGRSAPKFEVGNYVDFEGVPDAKGNVKVDTNLPINAKTADTKVVPSGVKGFRQAVKSETNKEMTSNGFWELKTERDIETQKRIEIQSCRNSALQFMQLLCTQEALKMPAKNRLEFLEALLEHYIVQFKERNTGQTAPVVAEESEKESVVE